jgi:hypothetical protein
MYSVMKRKPVRFLVYGVVGLVAGLGLSLASRAMGST